MHRLWLKFASVICCLVLQAAVVFPVHASSLQVAPTSVSLPAEESSTGITLTNNGESALRAQVRLFRWQQRDGKDVLEPTRDLVASPAMVQIAPGKSQLIRLVRLGAPPSGSEASYRVIVSELPGPKKTAAAKLRTGGLDFLLEYSIPIFLQPSTPAATYALEARVAEGLLQVHNTGATHAKLSELYAVDAAGNRKLLLPGLVGYVLPGQTRQWRLPAGNIATATLKATINGESVERTLLPAPATR